MIFDICYCYHSDPKNILGTIYYIILYIIIHFHKCKLIHPTIFPNDRIFESNGTLASNLND